MRNAFLFSCLMALFVAACADVGPSNQSPDTTSNSDGGAKYGVTKGALTYKQDADGAWTIPNTCTPTGTSADEIAVGPSQRLMCDPDGYVRLYYSDDPMTYPGAGQTGSASVPIISCLGDDDCTANNPYPDKNVTSTCVHTQSSDPDGFGVGTCLYADKVCYAAKGSPCEVKSWLQCKNGNCNCPVSANTAAAVTESCDGVDNNCDGKTDEANAIGCVNFWTDSDGDTYGNKAASAQCLCGSPAGMATNKTDCNDSSAAINPAATDVCDSADNNCDGKTDEPFADLKSDCGFGACAGGTTICSADGSKTVCSSAGKATSEVCDGADNDCNGKTDETYSDLKADCGVGACAGGAMMCLADKSGTECSTLINASSEVCDNMDNDCNGKTDETYSDLKADCGVGVCAGGSKVCSADKASTVCSTASLAVTETCDNKDNDCNGKTDETYSDLKADCGVGACAGGSMVCSADKSKTVCSSDSNASSEVCDGADNDCNGKTDETYKDLGASCGVGACAGGSMVCAVDGSKTVCSTAGKAGAETCNQIDDDCDGTTDVDTNGKALCDLKCPTVKKYDCNKWYTVNLSDDFANSIDTYQCAGASKAWPVKQSAKELFVEPIAQTGSTYTVQVKNSPGVFLSMLNDCAPAANTSGVGPTQCVAAGIASSAGSAGVSKGVVGTTYTGIDAPANTSVTFQIVCPL